MNSRIEALTLVEAACWNELERAAHEREHDWRLMALATVDGGGADLRTVVLRECQRASRTLVFFTDSRSGKVGQIRSQPEATLLVWSRRLGWQLRMRCRLQIETDGPSVAMHWSRLKMTPAAHDYLSPLPPGTPIDRFMPERGTREYFAVVRATVTHTDWLELHADGHRRALFGADGARWVNP